MYINTCTMKKILALFSILLLLASACNSPVEKADPEIISIIPAPATVEVFKGYYEITGKTVVHSPEGEKETEIVEYFNSWFSKVSGFQLETASSSSSGMISFVYVSDETLGKEGYVLGVDKSGITISAHAPAGLFYGVQSLMQMMPAEVFAQGPSIGQEWKVPFCKIRDYPRFGWRGMHLDVSRHFFSVDFIKRYIDLIAMHKMNVFHWHLTDDNGWRIEIEKYPDLTEVSAWRVDREDMPWREVTPPNPGEKATYGGYYTQKEVRDVIEYAARRHIMVIPEIEMPGHTSEVFAAYPELSCTGEKLFVQPGSYWPNTDIFCAGKEQTFDFIEDVLTEIIELFPSPYVHIGGDEATKTRWENCKLCQRRMKDEGLATENELQSYFIKRIEKFIVSKGKKMIGWDEILEGGLAPEATVMSWRGEKGGIEAAEMGHDVVMCPTSHCYFDYYQANPDFEPVAIGGFTTLKKVYQYEPVPEALNDDQASYILGAQGNVWTEYIATPEHAEYMAIPRMTALAEVVWSTKENRDWENFQKRLQDQFARFDAMGVNYSKGSWKVDIQAFMENGSYTIELTSEQYNRPIHYTLDGSDPTTASATYSGPMIISESSVIKAALFDQGELMEYPSTKEIVFHLGTGKAGSLKFPPARNYSGSGFLSLVDGLKGSDDFHDGYWLGFEGTDFEATIDLTEETPVSSVTADFYQNTGAWIFLPESVTFTLLSGNNEVLAEDVLEPESTMEVKGAIIEEFEAAFQEMPVRYVNVKAKGLKMIPDWHEGAGNKGWLFMDEIIIK